MTPLYHRLVSASLARQIQNGRAGAFKVRPWHEIKLEVAECVAFGAFEAVAAEIPPQSDQPPNGAAITNLLEEKHCNRPGLHCITALSPAAGQPEGIKTEIPTMSLQEEVDAINDLGEALQDVLDDYPVLDPFLVLYMLVRAMANIIAAEPEGVKRRSDVFFKVMVMLKDAIDEAAKEMGDPGKIGAQHFRKG